MEKLKKNAASSPNMASDDVCHLLELPAELRNRIYELVIPSNAIVRIRSGGQNQPGITRASRQLRAEALPMFYDRTRIEFGLEKEREYQAARSWVKTAARAGKLNAIKQFRVVTTVTIVIRLAEDESAWSIGVIKRAGCELFAGSLSGSPQGLADDFHARINGNGGRLDETVLLVLLGKWR
ncbi:hypothetical protein CERZMDRAFT_95128 [Cercospora zeae-maydis SCOH1-5]|uniref:F-box domain-containing protein n=1 Tax=Cercospora zeae-maydis SCOH1-5 TaxID=717836 RepID=A0A6A6FMN6_9PEZI|nr:hypothetical protein CERZMDRAFT_95128 [Cercospora zeae-maydis SCOH1-5]